MERLRRVAAIVAADVRIRFRRPSTLVVFLLLSALAYVWVPDPQSGKTLIQIEGKRALYNSAAIGVGTASLATIFVGLAGFYVISNAMRRDVASRCGFVIASTTMRGTEYLLGKFAGNVVFLTTFMAGFMATSMAMVVVRGEARLEPLVFMWQYLLLVPATIVFVSGLAIFFESVPLLRGRFGDVAYFFFWVGTLGVVAAMIEHSPRGPGLAGYFDFSGLGFLFDSMRSALHTTTISLGHMPFDPKKGVIVFNGLALERGWLMPRIVSTIAPVLLVFAARPFFHRFDPARVKQTSSREGRNWLSRLNALAKPLSRVARVVAPRGGQSLLAAARTDAVMTMTSNPLIVVAALVFAFVPATAMPIAFAAAAIFIADVSCREKRSDTLTLVYTAPSIKSRFVAWKLMSSAIVAAVILLVPSIRMIEARPASAMYLATGFVFVVAFATMLGVVSANPKTFLVLFLSFWYVVVNSGGHVPALDFAGWNGAATPAVMAVYAALAVAATAAAELFHRSQLR